jgi:CRISPR/Cas system-associated exonuclease Cas4 (RecB family)
LTKTIDTLVQDIYRVVEGHGGWDKTISQFLSTSIADVAEARFSKKQEPRGYLSLSSLGTPCDRKLWYRINQTADSQPLTAEALGTFFYGDLLEALVLALAMAAGHRVEGMQDRLDVHGIKGHRDAVIDGVTIDVKSASKHGFEKFRNHSLRTEDPFGYISQLSSYVYAGKDDPLVTDKKRGAFLVVQKDRFKLCLDVYDFTDELDKKEEEVRHVKAMVAGAIPEDRIPPVPQSKTSQNTQLSTTCGYCEFRKVCWPEARTFLYSTGKIYLVDVKNEPRVTELIE